MNDEPSTTDTFTDARGRRYIAGQEVHEMAWQRFYSVVDELNIHRQRGDAWREEVRAAQDEIVELRSLVYAIAEADANGEPWSADMVRLLGQALGR